MDYLRIIIKYLIILNKSFIIPLHRFITVASLEYLLLGPDSTSGVHAPIFIPHLDLLSSNQNFFMATLTHFLFSLQSRSFISIIYLLIKSDSLYSN